MKTSLRKLSIFAFLIGMIAVSCTQPVIEKDFDYGKVEKSVYNNKFFGLKVNVPDGWQVLGKGAVDTLMKEGRDMVAGDDAQLNRKLKAAEVSSANLLSTCKYPTDSIVASNPSMLVVAEKVSALSGVRTGKDYLVSVRKLLMKAALHYEIDENTKEEELGGRTFYILHAKANNGLNNVYQDFCATVINGFAVSFVLSYANEADRAELAKAKKSITFSDKE